MIEPDDQNPVFKLAADFINYTSKSVFLTGKAGSGKTTFLRHIVSTTPKRCVVVAPTGVAAINAGGVTMHSFFQLPFGPYLPGRQSKFNGVETADKTSLFKNIRFSRDKRDLINELQLLIIDEVSMVRCDMLDAMDAILRHFRKRPHDPFGGVQVLYIGDLYQLPPVAKTEEWELLKEHYESPFFFNAHAARESPPLYIELKKIYRQSDVQFIDLLNKVRNNEIRAENLHLLNSRYQEKFSPAASENYITLSTHNYKADAVNASELARLPGPVHKFKGNITGDFSDKSLPTEMELSLKKGAQVIFIKNDQDVARRYYNGKIAIISHLTDDEITVSFPNTEQEFTLEKETWRNIRYTLNRETGKVEEEEVGSFVQYPIRLAWAITIHKSQGLTFSKAIIDAGSSFAAGQVYVALSRCTSFEGLVLQSKISLDSISTDPRVIAFARKEQAADQLQAMLATEQQRFLAAQLIEVFDFSRVIDVLEDFCEQVKEHTFGEAQKAIALSEQVLTQAKAKQEVATRFKPEITRLMEQVPHQGMEALTARMEKAIDYFSTAIAKEMILPLQELEESLGRATKVKKYLRQSGEMRKYLLAYHDRLREATYQGVTFCKTDQQDALAEKIRKPVVVKKGKQEKGSSLKDTLSAFREGHDAEAIAQQRNLAPGTIEGHLAQLVKSGEIKIHELMSEEKLQVIQKAIDASEGNSTSQVKQLLGDEYSYGEIRMVMNHNALQQENKP